MKRFMTATFEAAIIWIVIILLGHIAYHKEVDPLTDAAVWLTTFIYCQCKYHINTTP